MPAMPYAPVNLPTAAPGPMAPASSSDLPGQGVVPFVRAAAPPRTKFSITSGPQIQLATEQQVPFVLDGTGYWLWLDLWVQLVTAGNAATVALAEDAPWAAISSVTTAAGGPQQVNLNGYALYLLNAYGGWNLRDWSLSADANVYSALTTGAGATAGSGAFPLRLPMAINDRNYIGLMGNQDRATKYNLNTNLAGSASVYSTAPTTLPTATITRHYGYLPVPPSQAADGRQQQQIPDYYGIIHYLTTVRNQAAPAGASSVNHYLTNLANAVRVMILVFRANGSRATANANLPTELDFFLGTDLIFQETAQERRRIMYSRYGFDAPSGVLVYDFIHDFGLNAGAEIGDQYVYLGNISEAQFKISYPTGFGSTNNSLEIITDALFVPPGIDIYKAA